MNLPDLTGSEAQVKWAAVLREQALRAEGWSDDQLNVMHAVNDSTWWIANRSSLRLCSFQVPAPHQLVGGPPPAQKARTDQATVKSAEQFAESVSQTPLLAKITIMALLGRLYKQGPVHDYLMKQAQELGKTVEEEICSSVNRDIEAINRILKVK
jgi:hypothetical protein